MQALNPIRVLEEHWGYASFRPFQLEIIQSVISGKDTLALLPTGGGKSICFQVPALAMEGMCLVISPLIALMKDQVAGLVSKGIHARLLVSGMSYREIDEILDECMAGNVKLLYLSPERLLSSLVKERIKGMTLNLIAVDEAHCISQWGYDFRPAYLKIPAIRELSPKTPVLALTATATLAVRLDIQQKLSFAEPRAISSSFARENLSYSVCLTEDKFRSIGLMLERLPGTSIIYVRTRRQASDIAAILNRNGIRGGFYHAGLPMKERERIQDAWISGEIRVIVATNAFGMGIDKPDVRSVIHYAPPANLEAYYQEAGRAGRDGKPAETMVFYNLHDLDEAERLFEENFPSLTELRKVYQVLAEFYQIGVGQGEGQYYKFDLSGVSVRAGMRPVAVMNCLKVLERNGLVMLTDAVLSPSKVQIVVGQGVLSRFLTLYSLFQPLLQSLLRAYGGIFENDLRINELELARSLYISESLVTGQLQELHQKGIIRYTERTDLPQFSFLGPREDSRYVQIDHAAYALRKTTQRMQLDAMLNFLKSDHSCRNRLLLDYFSEKVLEDCGRCDICVARGSKNLLPETIKNKILRLLACKEFPLAGLALEFPEIAENNLLETLRLCADAGLISVENGFLRLR